MNKLSKNQQSKILVFAFIIGSTILRLVPHPANLTPITAICLFAGAKLAKKWAFFIPIIALLFSDYLLLYINPFREQIFDFSTLQPIHLMFHSTSLFVYSSFLISSSIGFWIKNSSSISKLVIASTLASFQFYLITNLGVWASGYYNQTIEGLLQSYIMGIPFYKHTLIGDLFYTLTIFASYNFSIRTFVNKQSLNSDRG